MCLAGLQGDLYRLLVAVGSAAKDAQALLAFGSGVISPTGQGAQIVAGDTNLSGTRPDARQMGAPCLQSGGPDLAERRSCLASHE
jgi:hypothetical protein